MKLKPSRRSSSARAKYAAFAIALISLSITGVWLTIESNDQTAEYLVAAAALPAGSPVGEASVAKISANLGPSAANYVLEGQLPKGAYLLGPVVAGQLITKSQLASAVLDSRSPVVIESKMPIAAGIKPGSSVDVWVSKRLENNDFAAPVAIVLAAEVAQVIEPSGMFASAVPSVELWVPSAAVSPILAAISSQDSISLVLRPTFADQ
jgi:hypothetical protein